ncbi:hypothetical protein AMATHDRAFT_40421 [Amanita thiersii Skay4041]|uniref:Spt20-like SEP domain-containing protein n=1 Tax=Amanita thiersii Skay4041 TaxID=703135 RepID=A0A2A9NRP1_9AGAR|nr:hypothetical protein AMATHDRAFT_40421 [Amanita thiersii Skay4041]
MAGYNRSRFVNDLLDRTKDKPPSFTVHLYSDYWSLNNGSRFHYHIPIASLLDDIRAQRIPVDFLEIFDSARVPFYDGSSSPKSFPRVLLVQFLYQRPGCMIVEIMDYRPQHPKDPVLEKPERTRVVLHPNSESLWADICALNQRYGNKWTDMDALEVEARILLATAPPLCLDPDPNLSRITNHVLRATMPTLPSSLKRKAAAMEPEDDENDKARKLKILQYMATRPNRTTPSFHLLDAIQKARQNREVAKQPTPPVQLPSTQYNVSAQASPAPPGTPQVNGVQAPSPSDQDDKKKFKKKKSETPQLPFATTAFTSASSSQTPVSTPQTTHHFVNTHPQPVNAPSPAATTAQSPAQVPIYANVPSVSDTHLRVATPSQPSVRQYTQSPRPPSSQASVPVPAPPVPPAAQSQAPVKPPPPQPPAKPQIPTSVPNFPAQAATQHFLNQAVRNGVQKPPANLTAAMASQLQGHNMSLQQIQYFAQLRSLQQQHQRLAAQANGRAATPKTGVSSPAAQPQTALSPAHHTSPSISNQPLASTVSRSPMQTQAQQAPPPQLPQQSQQQSHQTQMAHSPPQQQPPQHHTQYVGYPQFNIRQMMPANSAAHQALQAAVAAAASAGGTRTPSNAGGNTVSDGQSQQHPQHQQHLQHTQSQQQSNQTHPTHPHTQHQHPVQTTSQAQAQPTPIQLPQSQAGVHAQHLHQQHPPQTLTQAQLYPQMYGYPQLPFGVQGVPAAAGRLPPSAYWSMGMGRGIPGIVNAQQISNMTAVGTPGTNGAAATAQMHPGMGKAAIQGGMQGR